VNKNTVLLKIFKMGINGNMFNFIRAFLSNRTFQVRVYSLSTVKPSENGSPEGSILSSVLFAIMINDLLNIVSSTLALHTDDICFCESESHVKHLEQLCQRSLSKVYQWCIESGFKIATSKSAAIFTKRENRTRLNYFLPTNQSL